MNPFSWWRMLYWRFRWYAFPRRRFDTKCQYCGTVTGRTMHAWATEDICNACAAPLLAHMVESQGERALKCCALGCTKLLTNKFLPFCDECMKKPELIKAWNEL